MEDKQPTPSELLRALADANPTAVCVISIGQDGLFYVNHTTMPVPFLCMMKETLQTHLIKYTAPPVEKKSPILTSVSPFIQKQ